MNYTNCTYKDLLQDKFFLDSQLNPTRETIQFWNDLIADNKELALEIDKAQNIIQTLPFRSKELSVDVQDELLGRIKLSIRQNKKERNLKNFRVAISVAASVALLCLFSWAYLSKYSISEGGLEASIENIEKPLEPVTQIQLIRTDRKEIAIEGDESVIQYDDKGSLSVNEEKITPAPAVSKKTSEPRYHQLIVPPGKRSSLALSDGTQIWVNANTRVVYPEVFDQDKREVYVEGEIFLEVASDPSRPFVVKTNRLDVNVTGTSFNVSAYEDDKHVAVVLVSGKVHVNAKDNRQEELSPNDMLCFENDQFEKTVVNVDNHISWRNGVYTLNEERLSVVLNKLSRYYGREIVWEPEVEELICSGSLNLRDNIYKLLDGLETAAPISFKVKTEKIEVYVKPKND